LVKLGYVSEEEMAIFFANESRIPYVRVSDYVISSGALNSLDENFCRQYMVIPVFKVQSNLFVAVSNPLDTALMDNLSKITRLDVEPLIASGTEILNNLNLYYGPEDKNFDIEKFIIKQSAIKRVPFHRETERLDLKIPVSIAIDDKDIVLRGTSSVDGFTQNISNGGMAIGLEVFLFLPKGIHLILDFKLGENLSTAAGIGEIVRAKGEIVHSYMGSGQKFFIGIKFTEIDFSNRNKLLKFAIRK
jgi:hypothetical protein